MAWEALPGPSSSANKRLRATWQRSGCLSGWPLLLKVYWAAAERLIRSHVMIIAIILAFTVYFLQANRKQGKGKQLLEGTVSSYDCIRWWLDRAKSGSGGLQVHILSVQHTSLWQRWREILSLEQVVMSKLLLITIPRSTSCSENSSD